MSEKKTKKSKRKHGEGAETVPQDDVKHDDDDKKEQKRAKRAEKKALMEQLPKTDEDGIAYTKLQLRRMMKRVKRGLPPIPTKAEEQELKRQEAITRKEEEAELAGLADTVGGDELEVNEEEADNDDDDDESHHEGDQTTAAATDADKESAPSRKRKKRSKPVPDDYVCQACKNEHQPVHWIYDCPNKITMKGTNHVAKKLRGIHAPDDRKVFVSGLAFDMKKRDVELIFKDCGTIELCKLLTFPDTGRCKGQAYVTFDCEASAKKAMKLSGTTIANNEDEQKSTKRKKKQQESPNKRKELKLKVTKVLPRTVTKSKNAA